MNENHIKFTIKLIKHKLNFAYNANPHVFGEEILYTYKHYFIKVWEPWVKIFENWRKEKIGWHSTVTVRENVINKIKELELNDINNEILSRILNALFYDHGYNFIISDNEEECEDLLLENLSINKHIGSILTLLLMI